MSIDDYINMEHTRFAGADYSPRFDDTRLRGQIRRVFNCMSDGEWRTLREIEEATGDPPASISAQLRHLRKERFGKHTVEKQARGNRSKGLFEYRLLVNRQRVSPNYMKNLTFQGDTAQLTFQVPRNIWVQIDNQLHMEGYRYMGKGRWIKHE